MQERPRLSSPVETALEVVELPFANRAMLEGLFLDSFRDHVIDEKHRRRALLEVSDDQWELLMGVQPKSVSPCATVATIDSQSQLR